MLPPVAPTPLGSPLTSHTSPVHGLAFFPAENTLAAAGDDGTVRLWNLTDPVAPTPLGSPLAVHTGPVNAMAFAPDGNTLAAAGADGTVRLWTSTGLMDLHTHIMERACSITQGGLHRAEWTRYVPELEYIDVCQA